MRRSTVGTGRAAASWLAALTALVLGAAVLQGQGGPAAAPPEAWTKLALTPPMGWNSWNKFA